MSDQVRSDGVKGAEIDYGLSPPAIDYPRQYNAALEFTQRHVDAGRLDKAALIDGEGEHTYGELLERVDRAGNALRGLGVRAEERVLLCMLDGIDLAALFWGAMKIGAVPVPLNTLLTPDDYEYILGDSRARVLVVSDALYEKFAQPLSSDPVDRVVVSGGSIGGREHLADLLARASTDLQAAPTTPDDVALWLYTSGSTGRPKAAMHLHRDLIYTAVHYAQEVLELCEQDVVFSAAKMFFAYGLGNSLTFPMFVGATAVVEADRPTPELVLDILTTHQPTVFFGVPTLYAGLLAASTDEDGPKLSSVRLCVSAGEALPEDVGNRWERRFGCEIVDGLGSTKLCGILG